MPGPRAEVRSERTQRRRGRARAWSRWILHTAGGFLLVRVGSRRGARRAPLAGRRGTRALARRSRRRPISRCRRTGSCSPNSGSPRPTRRRTERRGRVPELELASRGRAELERRALPAARRQRGGRALAPAIRGAESTAAVASGRLDAAAGDRSGARTLPRAANSPHAPHVGARSARPRNSSRRGSCASSGARRSPLPNRRSAA